VLSEHLVESAVQHAEKKRFDSAHAALRRALKIELGVSPDSGATENPVLFHLDRVLAADCSPALAAGFASVALAENHFLSARALFQKYVEIAPEAPDRKRVDGIIAAIDDVIRQENRRPTLFGRAVNFFRRVFVCCVMFFRD